MKAKINILGSCVSRVSLMNGNQAGHKIADENLEMGYFLDKQNIVCAMTPDPFTTEEIESVHAEELWDKSRVHTVKQSLGKETVSLLLEKLLDQEDVLWLNILDKLNCYAPDDLRVQQYMQCLADASREEN